MTTLSTIESALRGLPPLAPLARPLDGLIEAVNAAAKTPIGVRHLAVARALRPFLGRADLLDGSCCAPREDRYARRLLHADPAGRFALLALVWRPGQASPVHAHRAWCAFGVHAGRLRESWFDAPAGDAMPAHLATMARRAGDCGGGPAAPDAIHRLACEAEDGAISIHAYGVAGDAIDTGINRVYG
jgi:predicted metal-dependent enzyme (double-stranded beta helix superfamily)